MAVIDKAPNAPRGHLHGDLWPKHRYGPDGASALFDRAEDVPEGWADHPSKVSKHIEVPPEMETYVAAKDEEIMSKMTPGEPSARKVIMDALRAKGIKFKPTLSTELLRECLAEAEAAE